MRFRFLLRPGWLALLLAVLVFSTACYMLLAPWQFRRNAEQVAQNTAISDSLHNAPVPVDQVLTGSGEPGGDVEWRQVTLTGQYVPAGEAVARLRTVQGEAAFEVLTPFRLSDGRVVVVDRGYIRPVGDVGVPPYAAAPRGQVTVAARVRPDEPDNRDAFTRDGHREVYAVNSATVGKAAGLTTVPGYFMLVADQPGTLNALPLPQLDTGPFFSYALQWIAFGTMAIIGLVYFTWRETQPGGALTERPGRQRRSVAEMLAEDEARERAEEQRRREEEARQEECRADTTER